MCAIAGVIGLDADPSVIQAMLESMRRRGPDDNGVYQRDDVTLLHSRLTVIDPGGGKQPMILEWAGERYILIYNGELYNTDEIRSQLIKLGHTFTGHSDTEVVLHAYAEYGENCLNLFNGIFAFCVWEEKSRSLFLARDRIGVKPLFFSLHGDGFLFASEIKTILCYPTVEARLDAEGAAQLILLGPGRKPGSGVFSNIYEVEPGCCGYYRKGMLNLHRYWKLTDREHLDSFEETVEKVRFLVTDAIRRQMVSDVPVGTFLSGGLDSSIITAVCAREMSQTGERLHTFSVDYWNNDKYFSPNKFQPNSDGEFIRLMQKNCDTVHHWTVLSPEDLENNLEQATIARDLPGMADVDFSLLAFSKQIRQDVKVALSGECADEIFGGYPWYRDPEVRDAEGFPWAQNLHSRASLLSPAVKISSKEYVMDAYRQTCIKSDVLPGVSPQERRIKEMVNLNFQWFMQTLLDRKDRMSMFASLEVRVPFCDYRIAEYLYGVPWEMKDHQGMEKGLLRQVVQGLLPEPVLYRKKSPYPKTFDPRYEQIMQRRLEGILEDKQSALQHLIRREQISAVLNSQSKWPWYGQLMRRPQTMAYLIQLDFWLRYYHVQLDF